MSTYLVRLVVGPWSSPSPSDARGYPDLPVAPVRSTDGLRTRRARYSLNWFGEDDANPYRTRSSTTSKSRTSRRVPWRRVRHLSRDPAAPGPRRTTRRAARAGGDYRPRAGRMWFGDLVTMRWWNGIADRGVRHVHVVPGGRRDGPSWLDLRRPCQCVRGGRAGEHANHRVPVNSPDDASGMFDTLTYTKGGAVLADAGAVARARSVPRRHPSVPPQARVRQHRDARALGRPGGGDRRTRAQGHGCLDFQPGYPAITATRDGAVLRLTQRRFIPSHPDDDTVWPGAAADPTDGSEGEQLDRVLVEGDGLDLPARRARGAGGGQRRWLQLRSGRLRRRSPGPAHGPGLRRSDPGRAAMPGGRRMGGRGRRACRRVVVRRSRGGVRRKRPISPCGARS